MHRFIFVFAALLAVTAAYQECPSVTAKYPFDATRFSGDWHAIATNHKPADNEKKCRSLTVAFDNKENGTTISFKYNYINNAGEAKSYESIGNTIDDSNGAVSNFVTIDTKKGEKYISSVFKRVIFASDYDSYAIIISCKPIFIEETKEIRRDLHAYIIARDKTLPENVLHTLKSILTSYDIEYDSIKTIDNSDC